MEVAKNSDMPIGTFEAGSGWRKEVAELCRVMRVQARASPILRLVALSLCWMLRTADSLMSRKANCTVRSRVSLFADVCGVADLQEAFNEWMLSASEKYGKASKGRDRFINVNLLPGLLPCAAMSKGNPQEGSRQSQDTW